MITREELMLQVIPEVTYFDDNWGFGRMEIPYILVMIEVGKKFNISFTFVKKVTAVDDETFKEETVTASTNFLFVYPNNPKDPKLDDYGDFWKEVNKIYGER